MKILVTGAAGFLGFHLADGFLKEGHEVVGVDNFISGQKENLEDLKKHKNFSFTEADINDLNPKDWTGVSRIYHMACPASPPIYQKDQLHTLETCFTGSRKVFEIARLNKARILIASTSEIYGDPEVHPQHEDYRGNVNTMGPRSCYDEGKRVMETLGYIYSSMGVEVRTARIFNTYGPRMSPVDGRVMTNFITQALSGQKITVYGTGKQTRSFCFYSDLLGGLKLLMESDVIEPVNLGSQYEFSILELAHTIIKTVNPKLEIEYHPLPKDDPKQRRPNTERAKKLLGWETKVELNTGIAEMIEDMKARGF